MFHKHNFLIFHLVRFGGRKESGKFNFSVNSVIPVWNYNWLW